MSLKKAHLFLLKSTYPSDLSFRFLLKCHFLREEFPCLPNWSRWRWGAFSEHPYSLCQNFSVIHCVKCAGLNAPGKQRQYLFGSLPHPSLLAQPARERLLKKYVEKVYLECWKSLSRVSQWSEVESWLRIRKLKFCSQCCLYMTDWVGASQSEHSLPEL